MVEAGSGLFGGAPEAWSSSSAQASPLAATPAAGEFFTSPPAVSLPMGGGAIRGIGETFGANPVTGTGSMTIPIALSPGRGGFGPQLALGYDSGAGQGPFGLGWSLSVPAITRRTDRGLPRYLDGPDATEPDVFVLAGAEDLVPVPDVGDTDPITVYGRRYLIRRYVPRVESGFGLIERWTELNRPHNVFWRTVTAANQTSWYGRDPLGRIADPAHPRRIFSWLLTESYDDRGNAMTFGYRSEDAAGVDAGSGAERGRSSAARTTHRYLKRIDYGNLVPFRPGLDAAGIGWPDADNLPGQEWMFSLVVDYGDHRQVAPTPVPDRPWPARRDPFSSHRPRFEVRSYRLCRRILMFHTFADQPEVGRDCLVASTDLGYREPAALDDPTEPGYTVLASVTRRGYRRRTGGYDDRQYPPVTCTYSQPVIDPTVRFLDPAELTDAPAGLEGAGYRWLDLDGDGLAGVLSVQAGAWYYKANQGDGHFGPMTVVANTPAAADRAGRPELLDLTGQGPPQLVRLAGADAGFHAREPNGDWSRYVPFRSRPNLDWADPDTRLVDLTGDGRADVLTTRPDVVSWHAGLGADGFGIARRALAEGEPGAEPGSGPRLALADRCRPVFLADMTGDGLADLVQVDAATLRYWPNRGYGDFGPAVTPAHSPRLERPERFDPRRVRLVDVDGSGPADLVYLGDDGARLYLNRSGNAWSDPYVLDLPAATENLDAVQVIDLFGTGTACLVWSSGLPADAQAPVRYVDLLSTGKPHLLVGVDNNLGRTGEVEYTPSTHFSLHDRRAGRPWVGRLPFPVHCVSRVTTRDRWRGTTFSTSYRYSHGFYDRVEREFRGFGRVDQVDAEDYGSFAAANAGSPFVTADQRLYQPPTLTITWYHPGGAADPDRVREVFASEYATLPGFAEKVLTPVEVAGTLTPEERLEAARACSGLPLRRETYELDVTALTATPARQRRVRLYSVATTGYRVDRLQPSRERTPAVFRVGETESLTYTHDLPLNAATAADPRITHTLTLRRDELGVGVQTVTVGYPRRGGGPARGLPAAIIDARVARAQAELHLRYAETRMTADVEVRAVGAGGRAAIRHFRRRMAYDSRSYELTGIAIPASGYLDLAELRRHALSSDGSYPPVAPAGGQAEPVTQLDFHQRPTGVGPHARLIGWSRTRYLADEDGIATPSAPHPFGRHGPRGLVFEGYRLALTAGLLATVFTTSDPVTGEVTDRLSRRIRDSDPSVRALLDDPLVSGYVPGTQLDPGLTGQYWIRSGVAGYGPDAADGFYLPERYTDPFGRVATLGYDARRLYVQRSADPLGGTVRVDRFDYRVLSPTVIVDLNGNTTAVVHDILGQVVATATQGKRVAGRWQGDRLDGLVLDPPASQVADFCSASTQDDVRARSWLGEATSRFVYDLGQTFDGAGRPVWAARMAAACSVTRERHAGQLGAGQLSPIQVALECSDGGGAVLLTKVQAEQEPATGAQRWIVNGLAVANNKGNPVMQYEPSFVDSFGAQLPPAAGVCSVISYDAAGRAVRTDQPDGTYTRTEYGPWVGAVYDANDTVRSSRWYVARGSPDPDQPLPAGVTADRRAAWLAAHHDQTPALTVLDSLGRTVLGVAHNRSPDDTGVWVDDYQVTYTKQAPTGEPLWIRDPRGNLVEQFVVPPKPVTDPSEDLPAGCCPAYALTGAALFQRGMDDGDRWSLPDAAGAPLASWHDTDRRTDTGVVVAERRLILNSYDALHRPRRTWLRINADPPSLVEEVRYLQMAGLSAGALATARQANLVGQPIWHADGGGLATVTRVGLDGDVAERTFTVIADASVPVTDWNVTDPTVRLARDGGAGPDTFREVVARDALGRTVTTYGWHREAAGRPGGSDRVPVQVARYDRRGELSATSAYLQARTSAGPAGLAFTAHADPTKTIVPLTSVVRNARGQRLAVSHGNGTSTHFEYDPTTFRLVRRTTRRPAPTRGLTVLQDLRYTHDAAGNLTRVTDTAQDLIFFANAPVDASSDYVYDALYRLIEATGRENSAATGPPPQPEGPWPTGQFPSPGMTRRYSQRYRYDAAGNLCRLTHLANAGGWTRNLEPVAGGNRLARSWVGTAGWVATAPGQRVTHRHDRRGNLGNVAATSPTADLRWDWRDALRAADLQGGGTAFYAYGADGQRVAKQLRRIGGDRTERIYLGPFERFRRWVGGTLVEEIETHHLGDDSRRVVLVDDVLIAPPGPGGTARAPRTLPRFQYGDHLGSVAVELDSTGGLISREEFHPYGSTAFRTARSGLDAPPKRYRFTGMERDEETDLSCHGARYYAAGLARWTSVDPAKTAGGLNHFAYCSGSPVMASDPSGLAGFMDTERLSSEFSGTLLADDPVPAAPAKPSAEPDWIDATAGAVEGAKTSIANALDPPLQLPSDYHFPLPFGYYDTFIDRQVAREDAAVKWHWDTITSASVTVDWTDRLAAAPQFVLHEVGFAAAGIFYLVEHVVGDVLSLVAGGVEAVEDVLPGFKTSLEGLQGVPFLGPEFGLLARGSMLQLRSALPLLNDARMAMAIAESNVGLVTFDDAFAAANPKAYGLQLNRVQGVLKEAVARDIEGLSIGITEESQFLRMRSTTSAGRRADAPLFTGLTVSGESKPIILQVKDVERLSPRDLQQLVTSTRSAAARGGVVHLHINPTTVLTWQARSPAIIRNLRLLDNAIDRGSVVVFRYW